MKRITNKQGINKEPTEYENKVKENITIVNKTEDLVIIVVFI